MALPAKRILLVDDEERVLSALRRRLRTEFDVVTATSGARALEHLERDPDIAVIVADMQMPGMNGVALLKAARERVPHVRRLMLTGNADLETAMAAINEGKVDRFLRKPCEATVLGAAISRALAEHGFQSGGAGAAPSPPVGEVCALKTGEAFLAMVSAELGAPLGRIAGLAGAEGTLAPAMHAPESFEPLLALRRDGARLLDLLDRALALARLRVAADAAVPRTEIVGLLAEEVGRARSGAAGREITIGIESLRRVAHVGAVAEEIRLAMRELLSNAIRASAPGGHVSVMVKCEAETVAVTVIDSGPGVSAELSAAVAAPLSPPVRGAGRPGQGIGLGLARVKTIAALNGAGVSLEPLPRGGSQAILVFPRALDRESDAQWRRAVPARAARAAE